MSTCREYGKWRRGSGRSRDSQWGRALGETDWTAEWIREQCLEQVHINPTSNTKVSSAHREVRGFTGFRVLQLAYLNYEPLLHRLLYL